MGLMIGLQFDFPIKELSQHLLYHEQVFTGSSSCPKTLRILPPLTINQEEVDLFLEKITSSISKLAFA